MAYAILLLMSPSTEMPFVCVFRNDDFNFVDENDSRDDMLKDVAPRDPQYKSERYV